MATSQYTGSQDINLNPGESIEDLSLSASMGAIMLQQDQFGPWDKAITSLDHQPYVQSSYETSSPRSAITSQELYNFNLTSDCHKQQIYRDEKDIYQSLNDYSEKLQSTDYDQEYPPTTCNNQEQSLFSKRNPSKSASLVTRLNLSSLQDENHLLKKYRHVYAGTGGWFKIQPNYSYNYRKSYLNSKRTSVAFKTPPKGANAFKNGYKSHSASQKPQKGHSNACQRENMTKLIKNLQLKSNVPARDGDFVNDSQIFDDPNLKYLESSKLNDNNNITDGSTDSSEIVDRNFNMLADNKTPEYITIMDYSRESRNKLADPSSGREKYKALSIDSNETNVKDKSRGGSNCCMKVKASQGLNNIEEAGLAADTLANNKSNGFPQKTGDLTSISKDAASQVVNQHKVINGKPVSKVKSSKVQSSTVQPAKSVYGNTQLGDLTWNPSKKKKKSQNKNNEKMSSTDMPMSTRKSMKLFSQLSIEAQTAMKETQKDTLKPNSDIKEGFVLDRRKTKLKGKHQDCIEESSSLEEGGEEGRTDSGNSDIRKTNSSNDNSQDGNSHTEDCIKIRKITQGKIECSCPYKQKLAKTLTKETPIRIKKNAKSKAKNKSTVSKNTNISYTVPRGRSTSVGDWATASSFKTKQHQFRRINSCGDESSALQEQHLHEPHPHGYDLHEQALEEDENQDVLQDLTEARGELTHPHGVNSKGVPSMGKWGREKTFVITPMGYDSRFAEMNSLTIDSEEIPKEVKDKAIKKCNDWLTKHT